jgi:hypothetical protein
LHGWLLLVALLGSAADDIRFVQPTVEFPNLESCQRSGEQVRLEQGGEGRQAAFTCYQRRDEAAAGKVLTEADRSRSSARLSGTSEPGAL